MPSAASASAEGVYHEQLSPGVSGSRPGSSSNLSEFSETVDSLDELKLVIPTGRVNKSRRKRGERFAPAYAGFNASMEFLNKSFDLVGVVAHKGKTSPLLSAETNPGNPVSAKNQHLSPIPGQHELDIAMEALPTAFARNLRNSNGSTSLTYGADMWRTAIQDSLRTAVREVGLFSGNAVGNWSVAVICTLGGDASTKPCWLVTSCSQGNAGVTLIVGGRTATKGKGAGAKAATDDGPLCIRLNGNISVPAEEASPRVGQYMGEPDQSMRIMIQSSIGGQSFAHTRTDPVELDLLSSVYSARSETLPIAGRSLMRKMVSQGKTDTCMVLVDLLPFSQLAAEIQQKQSSVSKPDRGGFSALQDALCGFFGPRDEADTLTERQGLRMRTGALASAVFVASDYEK
mmetsp:Transcript_8564/g.24582  ORF Transcript_8564/g.24582 Transcript_8564/m.24582 type:complete len:402 (+) Transcript_8564:129-1334(+)